LWVYRDATKRKIGKIKDGSGFFNLSAGAWAICTILLWIVVFPAYLIKRGELTEAAKSNPVEVKGRGFKSLILALILVFAVFNNLRRLVPPNLAPTVNSVKQ